MNVFLLMFSCIYLFSSMYVFPLCLFSCSSFTSRHDFLFLDHPYMEKSQKKKKTGLWFNFQSPISGISFSMSHCNFKFTVLKSKLFIFICICPRVNCIFFFINIYFSPKKESFILPIQKTVSNFAPWYRNCFSSSFSLYTQTVLSLK